MKILKISMVVDTENEAKLIMKVVRTLTPYSMGFEIVDKSKKKGKK